MLMQHLEERSGAPGVPRLRFADGRPAADLITVNRLPPTPEIAMATLAYLEREDCNVADLAGFIASDQALAAGILKLANSASYGLRARVASIPQGVTRLGFARVKNLVLGLSVWHSFGGCGGSTVRATVWRHSVLVSGAARALAHRLGLDDTAAFTAGLIHDVGKLVLGLQLGAPYWDLVVETDDRDLAGIETERFGCDHAEIGGWLLERWHIPPALVEMVALHHGTLASAHVENVVELADVLVAGTDAESGLVRPDAWTAVQRAHPALLTAEEWSAIHANIVADQESIAELFG